MSESNESIESAEDPNEYDNDKDKDFTLEDCQNEIDSEDSLVFEDLIDIEDGPGSSSISQKGKRPYLRIIDSAKEFTGAILPGGHRFDRKLICIKYPGNVINPENAIKTLGGLNGISKAVDVNNRRLELRFRPEDGYSKPACGDRNNTCGFLLRVRVKKSRAVQVNDSDLLQQSSTQNNRKHSHVNNPETEEHNRNNPYGAPENIPPTFDRQKYENLSSDQDYQLPKLKVLGRVDTEFRFTNLCDFQYLPIVKNPKTNEEECIYDKIYPKDIPRFKWLDVEVPYFLPPAAFSRMVSVQQYVPKTVLDSEPMNVIGKTRKRRHGFTNFVSFADPEVPCTPPKGIDTAMRVKFLQNFHLEKIDRLFQERPIWSKNALMHKTNFTSDQLKILLPSVAYYFLTGPWRVMWVKLGYDPRKDPSARKYQTLDYRLKAMHGLGATVKCKRNYSEYNLPYKSTPVSKQKTTILAPNSNQESQKKKRNLNENVYIYKEGVIPPSRQMFYMYCDIHVEEIQEMLRKLPQPMAGTKCDPKLGWLPSGFDAQCREIINRQIRAELRKQNNIPEDHPTSLPRRKKFTSRKMASDNKRKPLVRRKANSRLTETMDESEPESVESFGGEEPGGDDRSFGADDE